MPEDFEAETPDLQEEGTPEAVEAAPETPPETETKPRTIPFERFQEVYDDLKSTRQGYQQMQMQVMQMQQQLMAASRPQAPAPKNVDPEIDDLIDPSLSKRISPLEARLARQEQINAALWAETESQRAWDYVKTSVDDLDELAPHIQSYLATLPQARANKITSDPDLVILTANFVRAQRDAGKSVGTQVAKQDLKQRTKSDAGTASPPNFGNKVDWTDPNLDWEKHEAMLERQRRSGR